MSEGYGTQRDSALLSITAVARDAADRSGEDRQRFIIGKVGGDQALHEEVQRRIDQLEAAHDPLLGPATTEQLRFLMADDPTASAPGLFPDGYEVQDLIGAGRFGDVYEAIETEYHGLVALKVIRGGHLVGVNWGDIQREVSRSRRIAHPNVVAVHSAGAFPDPTGPDFYIAMGLVRGHERITDWIASRDLTTDEILDKFERVCEAVEAAHAVGVLHGDLSAANVLVDEGGHPRLIDFGLATELAASESPDHLQGPTGPPAFMAPEMAAEKPTPSTAADQFSLGLLLFEMLSGKRARAFPPGAGLPEMLGIIRSTKIDFGPLRERGVPRVLRLVIEKAAAHDVQDRFDSVTDVLKVIRQYRRKEPVAIGAEPAGRMERAVLFAQRRPEAVAGLAAICFAVLALVGLAGSVVGAAQATRSQQAIIDRGAEVNRTFLTLFSTVDANSPRPLFDLLDGVRGSLSVITDGDPAAHADLSLSLGLLFWALGDYGGAARVYEDGWRELREHPDHQKAAANLFSRYLEAIEHVGDYDEILAPSNAQEMHRLLESKLVDRNDAHRFERTQALAEFATGRTTSGVNRLLDLHDRERSWLKGEYRRLQGGIGVSRAVDPTLEQMFSHPEAAWPLRTLEFLGEMYLELGELDEAAKYLKFALDQGRIARRDVVDDTWVSEWDDAYARVLFAQGRYREACAGFRSAYEQRLDTMDRLSPAVLASRRNVALAEWKLAESDDQRQDWLNELRDVLGDAEIVLTGFNEKFLAYHWYWIASVLSQYESPQALGEGLRLARQALAYYEEHIGPGGPRTKRARQLVAELGARLDSLASDALEH